MSKNQISII